MANMAQQTSRVELYRISVGSIRRVSRHSVIDALLGMPTQVPAGLVSHVREQRMHAGHCDRALEIELGLIIFFRDRIVALNGDRAQRLAASRDPVSDGKIVAKVHDRKQDESDRQYTQLHWEQDDDFEVRGEKSNRRQEVGDANNRLQRDGEWGSETCHSERSEESAVPGTPVKDKIPRCARNDQPEDGMTSPKTEWQALRQ
jgi:hypothetical protein